jgi:hypothetical protein
MDKLNKLISIIRLLREENGGGPTMSTASTVGKAGFGGSAQGFDPGPTAGKDLPIGKLDGRRKVMRRLPPPYKQALLNSKKGM